MLEIGATVKSTFCGEFTITRLVEDDVYEITGEMGDGTVTEDEDGLHFSFKPKSMLMQALGLKVGDKLRGWTITSKIESKRRKDVHLEQYALDNGGKLIIDKTMKEVEVWLEAHDGDEIQIPVSDEYKAHVKYMWARLDGLEKECEQLEKEHATIIGKKKQEWNDLKDKMMIAHERHMASLQ